MKPSVPLLFASAVFVADAAFAQEYSSPLQYTDRTPAATPSAAQTVPTATPQATSQPEAMLFQEYQELPHQLKQFIMEMSPRNHLEERQQAAGGGGGAAGGGVAAGGGAPPPGATPTQLSPITVYDIGAGPQTYTQLFKSPPEQWSSAAAGTIGLGTIASGTAFGKVKTYNNPAPTVMPEVLGAVLAGGAAAAALVL